MTQPIALQIHMRLHLLDLPVGATLSALVGTAALTYLTNQLLLCLVLFFGVAIYARRTLLARPHIDLPGYSSSNGPLRGAWLFGDVEPLRALLTQAQTTNRRVVVSYGPGGSPTAWAIKELCDRHLLEVEVIQGDGGLTVALVDPLGTLVLSAQSVTRCAAIQARRPDKARLEACRLSRRCRLLCSRRHLHAARVAR